MCFPAKSATRVALTACVSIFCTSALLLWPHAVPANETLEDVEQKILSTTKRLEELDAEIEKSRALKKKLDKALKASNEKVNERQARYKNSGRTEKC